MKNLKIFLLMIVCLIGSITATITENKVEALAKELQRLAALAANTDYMITDYCEEIIERYGDLTVAQFKEAFLVDLDRKENVMQILEDQNTNNIGDPISRLAKIQIVSAAEIILEILLAHNLGHITIKQLMNSNILLQEKK